MRLIIAIVFCSFSMACAEGKSNEHSETTKNENVEHTSQQKPTVQEIDVNTYNEKIKSNPGIILDVRTPEEIANGYIPGAVFMNFYDSNFSEQLDKLDKSKPIYLYCRSGSRSGKTGQMLLEKGFKDVYNLKGGYNAWESAGMEIKK